MEIIQRHLLTYVNNDKNYVYSMTEFCIKWPKTYAQHN